MDLHSLLAIGKRIFFFDDEGPFTDDGDASDWITAFRGKLYAGLELLEEVVDGRGREPRCALAHCFGGKLIVVIFSYDIQR